MFTKIYGVTSQNTIFLLLVDSKLCSVAEFITRSWFRFVLLFRILLASWMCPSICSLIQQHFSDIDTTWLFLWNSVWTSCHSPVGDRAPPTGHAIFSGQRDGLLCRVCLVESSKRWGAHKGMVTSDTAYECLVTFELSCMLLSHHHIIPWPVGQDYASFSHADNGDMELLVALFSLSLSLSLSLSCLCTHVCPWDLPSLFTF